MCSITERGRLYKKLNLHTQHRRNSHQARHSSGRRWACWSFDSRHVGEAEEEADGVDEHELAHDPRRQGPGAPARQDGPKALARQAHTREPVTLAHLFTGKHNTGGMGVSKGGCMPIGGM
jgi:hypothetical protein